ncbi:hypothetical protein, partial [Stenotrophomonas maltophilia]|uniref:hypothetical protein n=1 Tax=Stenotrophomonas maltophilia TaxID=40324 RepID=UPI0039C1C1BD
MSSRLGGHAAHVLFSPHRFCFEARPLAAFFLTPKQRQKRMEGAAGQPAASAGALALQGGHDHSLQHHHRHAEKEG